MCTVLWLTSCCFCFKSRPKESKTNALWKRAASSGLQLCRAPAEPIEGSFVIRHYKTSPPYLTTRMLEMAHTGVWGEVGAHTELFCSAVRCHHSERASPEAPAGPGAAEHHE